MKNRAAVLALLLLSFRAASAQVEVRVAPGATAAPLPIALALPGASLSAAPSFAAPAIGALPVAAPVLAAPAALPAAAAPVGAPALVPAAAAPAAAVAAAPAAHDAAPALNSAVSAAIDAPERLGGSGRGLFDGGSERAAAAAVPSDSEIEGLFAAAHPASKAVATLSKGGPGFAASAADIISQYTFVRENLIEGLRRSPAIFDAQGRQVIKAVEDLISVADKRDDPAARRFLDALGRKQAAAYSDEQKMAARLQKIGFFGRRGDGEERRHMPRNDLGSGEYWDMAAGMNAGGFILRELEPGTRYSFFDLSPFVVSYLNAIAARHGAEAAAIEADILKLKRPENPLAVLRTKNAVAYVPGFERKLSEMADWIAPGGRLVVQNDPMAGQRLLIVNKHGPLALRLLEEGWSLDFEFASSRTASHALDTLIFTRPKSDGARRSAAEARDAWSRYLAAVQHANAREGF